MAKSKIGKKLLFSVPNYHKAMYTYHNHEECKLCGADIDEILKQPQGIQDRWLGKAHNTAGFHRSNHSLKSSIRHTLKKEMMDDVEEYYKERDEEIDRWLEEERAIYARNYWERIDEEIDKEQLRALYRELDGIDCTERFAPQPNEEGKIRARIHAAQYRDKYAMKHADEVRNYDIANAWMDHDYVEKVEKVASDKLTSFEINEYVQYRENIRFLCDLGKYIRREQMAIKTSIDRKSVARKSRASRKRA